MTSELSEGGIVRELAERACRRITRRVIRSLRETKTGMLSGDNSIWLQTPQGEEWDMKDEDKREKSAVAENDIIDYLTIHYVYSAASDWSNPRIRKYLY